MNRATIRLAAMVASAALLAAACANEPDTPTPATPTPTPPSASGAGGGEAPEQPGAEPPAGERPPSSYASGVCAPEDYPPEAFERAGMVDENTGILPNGRRVRPAGTRVELADMALGLAVHPAGTHAYAVHAESKSNWDGVWVIDLATGEVVQQVKGVQAYHGVAVDPAGERLVVAGLATGLLYRFAIGADGQLTEEDPVEVGSSLIDVVMSADGATAWAMSNTNSQIFEVDMASGAVETRMQAGNNPYALVLDEDLGRAFASNLSGGTVAALDLASGEALAFIEVGKNPEGLAIDRAGHRLYVANSDSDTVSVIDTEALEVVATWDLTGNTTMLTGGALDAVHFDPASGRLYAAMARRNEVDVIDTKTGTVLGAIPTGHYPVEVTLNPAADTLLVLAAKGFGSRSDNLKATPGHLNIIPLPADQAALDVLTAEVADNNLRALSWMPQSCGDDNLPPALRGGPDKPIKHVVLIVKENKTYDVVLGDDPSLGDGDPELTLFGEEITPNIHRLARDFVNLDNFYSEPERSIQGHLWVTMADCNDFVEKIHQISFAMYGFEPATIVQGGTIFDHCLAHGVSFRNYGEFPGFGHHVMDDFEPFVDHKYPFWTMSVPDVEKAQEFIRELDQGIFPEFVFIVLPNDHTYGGDAGKPTPESMVADNDAGLGMIVEAISNSEYWPETAIFIIEDDPQGPPDHIHSHRSICVVVSPHVRRGYVSSVQYSIPSIHATIERILELPPLNRNTLEALPMIDIFMPEDQPTDFAPFEALPNKVPFATNPAGTEAAMMSAQLDFSMPDRAPGLGMVLWKMIKGDQPLPPYAKFSDE